MNYSNNLQNYLFSYNKKYNQISYSADVMYHLEDYILPSNVFNDRKVESFHGGIKYKFINNKISINLNPSFQFTYIDRWDDKTNYFTIWNHATIKIFLGKYYKIFIENFLKKRMNEYLNVSLNDQINYYKFGINYDIDNMSVSLVPILNQNILIPAGNIKFMIDNYYFC